MNDTINKQAVIDAVLELNVNHRVSWKDAIIDIIDALLPTQPKSCEDAIDRYAALAILHPASVEYKEMKALPPVHPKQPERKKGKWIRRKNEDCWECSECHAVLENSDIENHNFYYCYHCGADMRGENND